MVQRARWWRTKTSVTALGCTAHTFIIPSDTDAKFWKNHLWKSTIYFLPKPSCNNLSSFICATGDSPVPHFLGQYDQQGCKACGEEFTSSSISKAAVPSPSGCFSALTIDVSQSTVLMPEHCSQPWECCFISSMKTSHNQWNNQSTKL